jgi:hypothetical protein
VKFACDCAIECMVLLFAIQPRAPYNVWQGLIHAAKIPFIVLSELDCLVALN